MKRLIAAAVLFAVVLTAYFTGYFYIKNVCKEAEALLEECVAEYNANENALTLGVDKNSPILPALSALFVYLRETQKTELKNIKKIRKPITALLGKE